MARRITIALIGDTEEERDYIKKFTEKDRMEGWERFEDGTGFTIYAANCFDPLPDINKMLCHLHRSLKRDSLPYVLRADDYYDVYEITAHGFQIIGGYEVVDLDPDGCGPIKKYRDYPAACSAP